MKPKYNNDCRKCSTRKRLAVWAWRLREGVRLLAVDGQTTHRLVTDTNTNR